MQNEKMDTQKEEYVSISKAALLLEVSKETIVRWYKWWESDAFAKPEGLSLPEYFYKDRRGTRFFKIGDVEKLRSFGTAISTTHRGVMSEFNAAYQWGKRGNRALGNKGTSKNEVLGKMR